MIPVKKAPACLCVCIAVLLSLCGCEKPEVTPRINGVALSEYTIIYNSEDLDYSYRAAQYIQSEIESRLGISLPLHEDDEGNYPYEIIVGETARPISAELQAPEHKSDFAILANDHQVAIEGRYFTVAAAAYYFVDQYITDTPVEAQVPTQTTVQSPIVEEPNNVIFLIGDGMGPYQTKIFDYLEVPANATTDGEKFFYGYMLSANAFARTNSYSGTTDSAAGGTALATGCKTHNGNVGQDQYHTERISLTEFAAELGKATAVMSTDSQSGATPAAFSAHVDNRDDAAGIYADQLELAKQFGTIYSCNLAGHNNKSLEKKIRDTLNKLDACENGFFLMYEEGHIDKFCHNQNVNNAFLALLRFNQAIGVFMEYAFYHPDTFVVITADHETGSLTPDENGNLICTTNVHSGTDVPVMAHGYRSECFTGVIENVQIPKTIAKMWGAEKFGLKSDTYPPLF